MLAGPPLRAEKSVDDGDEFCLMSEDEPGTLEDTVVDKAAAPQPAVAPQPAASKKFNLGLSLDELGSSLVGAGSRFGARSKEEESFSFPISLQNFSRMSQSRASADGGTPSPSLPAGGTGALAKSTSSDGPRDTKKFSFDFGSGRVATGAAPDQMSSSSGNATQLAQQHEVSGDETKTPGWRQLTSRLAESRSALGGLGESFKDKLDDVVKELTRVPSNNHEDMTAAKSEEVERVTKMIKAVSLEVEDELVVVRLGGALLGTGDDEKTVKLTWMRATEGGSFTPLEHVVGYSYLPNLDDHGARICVQASLIQHITKANPSGGMPVVGFAEVGPIMPAKRLEVAAGRALEQGSISFERLELIECQIGSGGDGGGGGEVGGYDDNGSGFVPKTTDVTCSLLATAGGGVRIVGNQSGKVLLECGYSVSLRVGFEPSRSHIIIIRQDATKQAKQASTASTTSPATSPTTSPSSKPLPGGGGRSVTLKLRARIPAEKDLIGLLVRRWRQEALGPNMEVNDYPEIAAAKEKEDRYYQMKVLAAKAWKGEVVVEDQDDEDDNIDDGGSSDRGEGGEEEEEDDEQLAEVRKSFALRKRDAMKSKGSGRDRVEGPDDDHGNDGEDEEDDDGDGDGSDAGGRRTSSSAREEAGDDYDGDAMGEGMSLEALLTSLATARHEQEEASKMLSSLRNTLDEKEEMRLQAARELKLALQANVSIKEAGAVQVRELVLKLAGAVQEVRDLKERTMTLETSLRNTREALEGKNDQLEHVKGVMLQLKDVLQREERDKANTQALESQVHELKTEVEHLQTLNLESNEKERKLLEEVEARQQRESEVAELKSSLLTAQRQLMEGKVKLTKSEQTRMAREETSKQEIDELKNALAAMETQRNSLKSRADSMQKDLQRQTTTSKAREQASGMDLKVQLSVMRAERDAAKDEFDELRTVLEQQSIASDSRRGSTSGGGGGASRRGSTTAVPDGGGGEGCAACLCQEGGEVKQMERVKQVLEDSLKEKSIQLESAAQTNAALADRIQELEQQLRAEKGQKSRKNSAF